MTVAQDTRCVSVCTADDVDRTCVMRLQGCLGRGALTRVDAVLHAVELAPHPLIVDLSAARTADARLLRMLTRVIVRRRAAGRPARLRGVHPDVLPALEQASLPETFLVYEAVRAARSAAEPAPSAAPERDLRTAS